MDIGTRRSAGPTLGELAVDFDLTLAAQNKSTQTRRVYGTAVRQLGDFLTARGMPTEVAAIAREHVEAYLADLLARGCRRPRRRPASVGCRDSSGG